MAENRRFELSSSSADGSNFPGYWNGQRSHFSSASNLKRPSSFQANLRSPILTVEAKFPESTSLRGENSPLSQVLLLDRLSMGDQKCHPHLELKRVTNAVVETIAEDPSLSPVQAKPLCSLGVEELKQVRSCVTENSLKARKRINFLNEAIYKVDKYCRTMLPRKRSRTELSAHNLSFSVDQSALGGNLLKAGRQNHSASNCVDLGSQRPDKKKSTVPNKRARTSMMDMQVEGRPTYLINAIQRRPNSEIRLRPRKGHGFRSNVHSKNHEASPTIITKGKDSPVPCSGSGASVNSSANVSRTSSMFDSWERTSSSNRGQITGGSNSRKCPFSTGPSSTTVAQWTEQKPPKHQRTKKSLVPPVSNHDDVPNLVEGSLNPEYAAKPDSSQRNGQGFLRWASNNSALQKTRLKNENISSLAALSENQVSGAGDKRKDKNKKQGDADKKIAAVCRKVGSLVLPSKKSKAVIKEESGDGAQRQGRSGRASTRLRMKAPPSGKLENHTTMKQLRSTRPSTDKVESKTAESLTKKISLEQRPVTRPRRRTNNGLPDLTGTLDDDREELLAAANASISASDTACSGPFWKQMEPFFAFLTREDLDFLKQLTQVREVEDVDATLSPSGSNQFGKADLICSTLPENLNPISLGKQRSSIDECVDNEYLRPSSIWNAKEDIERPGKIRHPDRMPPLSQRLLSALIVEEDSEEEDGIFYDDPRDDCVHYTSEDSPCANCMQIESETKNEEFRGMDEQHTHGGKMNQDELQSDNETSGLISGVAAYDIPYQEMDLDQRIVLELQSIGIFLESVPDLAQSENEEIQKNICKLKDELHQQVSKNKHHVQKLEKAVLKGWEVEEREREVLAMNKQVESAYNKYMGLQASKRAGNKVLKQATLGFVKQTLAKCRMFEETGKTSFSDESLKERMLSISSKEMDKRLLGDAVKSDTANVIAENSHVLLGIKTSDNPNVPSEQANPSVVKDEVWSTCVIKRELLSEEVNRSGVLRGAAALGTTLLEGAKGKRTKRDRRGKVQTKEILTRPDSNRSGRSGLSNAKGERKNKLKPTQKTAQMSAAANGLLGKPIDAQKPSLTQNDWEKPSDKMDKVKNKFPVSKNSIAADDDSHDNIPIDLSHLQLPNLEDIYMGGEGQDLSSWLNFEDDDLLDAAGDLTDLCVPKDDLADLNLF